MCACAQFERTGLHRACSHGYTDVVTRLMKAGANINSRDKVNSQFCYNTLVV